MDTSPWIRKGSVVSAFLLTLGGGVAGATTLTFATGGSFGTFYGDTTYSEAGFDISGTGPAAGPYKDIFHVGSSCTGCPFQPDGYAYASIQYTFSGGSHSLFGFYSYASTLILRKSDLSAFTMQGFQGAEFFGPPFNSDHASAIRVTGIRGDASTYIQDFLIDDVNDGTGPLPDFQTFSFGSSDAFVEMQFTGLPGVLGEYFPGYGPGLDFTIDNIVLDEGPAPPEVPEPLTLAMVGSGLAVMARRRRTPRP